MVGPQWSDDADTPALQSNLDKVAEDVALEALGGGAISSDLIQSWHAAMYDGIAVPSDAYVGKFRGNSNYSDLLDAEVQISGIRGVRSYRVFGEVDTLLDRLNGDIGLLAADADLDPVDRDMEVLRIAAYAHGEWVRIHPFANGNGRTARLLVLWVLASFNIPPLLAIRPRPDAPYGSASKASMEGDHAPFELHLRDLYAAEVRKIEASRRRATSGTGGGAPDAAE